MSARTKASSSHKHHQNASKKPTGMDSRLVATMLLTRVVDDGRNLDGLVDPEFGAKAFLALSKPDRALAKAIATSALRHRTAIEYIVKKIADRPPPRNARFLVHTLHIAIAQTIFMDVPESAAVNLGVSAIASDKRTSRFKNFANAILRRVTREKETLEKLARENTSPFPAWLSKTLRTDFGKQNATQIGTMISHKAHVDLTVKADPENWAQRLGGFVLPTGSVRLTSETVIPELEGFDEGEWWVQDAASALPAQLMKAEAGSEVLELCAAPGGKTAQLAHAGCKVTAVDISEKRISRLAQNLDRLGFEATTVAADILEWEPGHPQSAILLDAPCSSTGTMRRHPDIAWSKSQKDVHDLAQLQHQLIVRAIGFLKPEGTLVFSNCSLMKEEGENLLARLLSERDDIELDPISEDEIPGISGMVNGQGALRCLPHHLPHAENEELGGMDGFFACRLKKLGV